METPSPDHPLYRVSAMVLRAVLLLSLGLAALDLQWMTTLHVGTIFAVTLAPNMVAQRGNIDIPPALELVITLFIFCTLFLGEMKGFYGLFWWWDLLIHLLSGVLLGILAFLLVHLLDDGKGGPRAGLKPGFIALFVFTFAMCIGALWEVLEYGIEIVFGINTQREMWGDPTGHTDTMWDLIFDMIGAGIISVAIYGYLRGGRPVSIVGRWVRSFVRANPQVFKSTSQG